MTKIEQFDAFRAALQNLGLQSYADEFEHALCDDILVSQTQTLATAPRTVAQANQRRDALIRFLYNAIITFIVDHANQALRLVASDEPVRASIAIVDFAPYFCNSESNQLSHLLDNYAAERLRSLVFEDAAQAERDALTQAGVTENIVQLVPESVLTVMYMMAPKVSQQTIVSLD